MKVLKNLMGLVVLLALVACNEDDTPVMKSVREYSLCFNLVENVASGSRFISKSPVYVIEQDFVNKTATVQMLNVKFAESMPEIDMTIQGLSFATNTTTGALEIAGGNIAPLVDGQPYENFSITNFKCEIKEFGLAYLPEINISYTINNVFRVTVIPTLTYYYGKTSIVNDSTQSLYENVSSVYGVRLDAETMTADVEIERAQFAQSMPSQNMKFEDIPVSVYNYGYEFSCDSVVPVIGKVPYPGYKVTNLVGVVSFVSGMKLVFDCMDKYSVSAQLATSPETAQ